MIAVRNRGTFCWRSRPCSSINSTEDPAGESQPPVKFPFLVYAFSAARRGDRSLVRGGAAQKILMCWETWSLVRLEHAVAERVLSRHLEIGLGLRPRHEGIGAVPTQRTFGALPAVRSHEIESVELPVGIFGQVCAVRVRYVVGRLERFALQRYAPAVRVSSGAHRVGAGKAVKEVVGRAVLLNDDDDVLDSGALRRRAGDYDRQRWVRGVRNRLTAGDERRAYRERQEYASPSNAWHLPDQYPVVGRRLLGLRSNQDL